MGILPVVNLEQVIAQSPALVGERAREQKKEEGPAASGQKPGVKEESFPSPAAGILPVRRIDSGDRSEEGLEKEDKSEYPPGKEKDRSDSSSSSSGGPESSLEERKIHRLDIEA